MWCLSLLASFRPAKLRSCLYSDPVSSLDPRDNTIRTGRFRSVPSTPRDTKSSNGAPLPPCRPSRADRLRGSCRQVPVLRSASACGCMGVATGPSHASHVCQTRGSCRNVKQIVRLFFHRHGSAIILSFSCRSLWQHFNAGP